MRIYATALLMLLILAPLGLAQAANQPLDVTLLSTQPVPANPGDLLDVYVQVENTGDDTAQGVQIQLLESGAFLPDGKTLINAGTVSARSAYVAHFTVRVKQDASTGDSPLRVQVKQQGSDWQERTVDVSVQPDTSAIYLASVKADALQPGETGEVTVKLENLADSRLRDVRVGIDLSETPLTPLTGSSQQVIDTLLPKRTIDVTFQIAAQPSASADLYRVPITIRYTDELGNTQEREETIGLRIDAEPRVQAYLDQVERQNGDVLVTVRLVNKGLSEVRFVEATIGDGNYTIPPQDRNAYLGNIDSDDWETLRFSIETEQQNVDVPFTYTYRDPFNNEHTGEEIISINVPPKESSTGGIVWLLIIAAIIVVGIVIWRRRK